MLCAKRMPLSPLPSDSAQHRKPVTQPLKMSTSDPSAASEDFGVESCQVMANSDDDVELLPSEGASDGCCAPSRFLHRLLFLAVLCFLNFGSYFCYDNPAALEDAFTNGSAGTGPGMGLSQTDYGLLYTVYSWPNAVFPLIGGLLIDGLLGIRLGSIVFAGFIMLGQLIFALGTQGNAFWLMLLGRVFFAVGGENLAVCQNNYAVKWFKGKELNTVFGIQLSFARIGSSVNMYTMAPLFGWLHGLLPGRPVYFVLGSALLLGAGSTVVSFLCGLVLAALDRRRDRHLAVEESKAKEDEGLPPDVAPETAPEADFSFADVLRLPLSLWLLSFVCVAFYNATFPFIGFGLDFYKQKFHLSQFAAETANSLVYLISIGASPLFGMVVDGSGRNVLWTFTACLLSLGGMALLTFTHLTPFVGVALLGLGYSLLAASLWSMTALVVPERLLGTAFGAMQSVQNLGMGVVFVVAGEILDKGGYLILNLFFLGWLGLAAGGAVVLFLHDRRKGGVLAMGPRARDDFLAANPLR